MKRLTLIVLLLASAPRSEAQYGGGAGTLDDPYQIATVHDWANLAARPDDWNRNFLLIADLDMRDLPKDALCMVGTEDVPFGGVFDGDNHTITHLTTTDQSGNGIGLFGQVRNYNAEVCNIVLIDPNVYAPEADYVGALVGRVRSGTVRNCHVIRTSVNGHMGVGGLVGWNQGAIAGCSATGVIAGALSVGGLVGVTFWGDTVTECHAHASVSGTLRVGGLAGNCSLAEIHWCSAAGDVEGGTDVGGFVGRTEGGIVTNCYSTASATGSIYVGGFVGRNDLSCDCSAGALPGEIIQCYATGTVHGDSDVGGLVGFNDESIIERSFWDHESSGQSDNHGGTGLTTAAMQQPKTFIDAHWDFILHASHGRFWIVRRAPDYPKLAWQLIPGDFDEDGDIDALDFSTLACHWKAPDSPFWTGGTDLTDDARVDASDIALFCRSWLGTDR